MLSSSLHVAESVANVYDRVEAYDCAGVELKEAYVGLKRLCTAAHKPEAQVPAPMQAVQPAVVPDAAMPIVKTDAATSSAGSEEEADVQRVEQHLGRTVLDDLERSIASPEFVRQLKRSRQCPHSHEAGTEELDELLGEYVIVNKEDAVNAMASYIAAWLSNVPEAQKMDPEELQRAVLHGVKDLKKTRFSQVLTWGKYAYRGAAFAYSAFTVYNNPWLVRAVVAALWSAGSALVTVVF